MIEIARKIQAEAIEKLQKKLTVLVHDTELIVNIKIDIYNIPKEYMPNNSEKMEKYNYIWLNYRTDDKFNYISLSGKIMHKIQDSFRRGGESMSAIKEHYPDIIEKGIRKAPTEKPILFNSHMVKAILEGRKTQTRRVVKIFDGFDTNLQYVFEKNSDGNYIVNNTDAAELCKYGAPGTRLWVRETTAVTVNEYLPFDTISYRADNFHKDVERPGVDCSKATMCREGWHDKDLAQEVKWTPSNYVKKIHARIWLEITEIRIERLQDISYNDCVKEGIEQIDDKFKNYFTDMPTYNQRISFKSLWQNINGISSWVSNPWVWVIKFKVLSTTGKENIQ